MENKKVKDDVGVLSAIKNCERDYASDFTLPGGIKQNMPSIIRKNNLYNHGKFESGDIDENAYKIYFYKVSTAMCDNATKNIDIDINNVRLYYKKTQDRLKTRILNTLIIQYMEENNWSYMFNNFSVYSPRFGSLIVRKIDTNEIEFKDLREIEYCPIVNNSSKNHDLISPYKLFPFYLSLKEFLGMKDKGWDKSAVMEIYDKYKKLSEQGPSRTPNIRIVEAYIDLPSHMFEDIPEDKSEYNLYKVIATIDGNYYGQTRTLTSNERPLNCEKILY